MDPVTFDIGCKACSRLIGFLEDVKAKCPDYYCKPVPPFGDPKARLLVIGLAPGLHGANRTGRPFTGDHAGILLYKTLYKTGFANREQSIDTNDELILQNCRITNAVKCLPPANKPVGAEIANCNRYLKQEIMALPEGSVMIALGKIAHDAALKAIGMKLSSHPFKHGARHLLSSGRILIDSYHCSRYNTQTRRLSTPMFENIFETAKSLL